MADAHHVTVLFTDLVGSTELASASHPTRRTSCAGRTSRRCARPSPPRGAPRSRTWVTGSWSCSPWPRPPCPAPWPCSRPSTATTRARSAPSGLRVGSERRGGDQGGRTTTSATRWSRRPACAPGRRRPDPGRRTSCGRWPVDAAPTPSARWASSSSRACPSPSRPSRSPGSRCGRRRGGRHGTCRCRRASATAPGHRGDRARRRGGHCWPTPSNGWRRARDARSS